MHLKYQQKLSKSYCLFTCLSGFEQHNFVIELSSLGGGVMIDPPDWVMMYSRSQFPHVIVSLLCNQPLSARPHRVGCSSRHHLPQHNSQVTALISPPIREQNRGTAANQKDEFIRSQ